jgi:hypothetical protein
LGSIPFIVYQVNGQTQQVLINPLQLGPVNTINNQANIQINTPSSALSAGVWVKVGFVYDPTAVAAKQIAIYVNNVDVSAAMGTWVTQTQMQAGTFPSGTGLTFFAGNRGGSATTAGNCYLDFWAFGQLAV